AGNVNPRLDCEGHSGRERRLIAGHNKRWLVGLQTDSVSRTVDEMRAVPARRDDPSRRGVDGLAGNTGRYGGPPGAIRSATELVDSHDFFGDRLERDAARDIADVPTPRRPAVQNQNVTRFQSFVARAEVRVGTPRSADDERAKGIAFASRSE